MGGSQRSQTLQGSLTPSSIPNDIKRMLTSVKKLHVLHDIRDKAERLSPYEIHLSLDPEQTAAAAEARFAAPAYWIEGLRNSLVVLPLMITWLSLGIAGAAYEQSVPLYSRAATATSTTGPSSLPPFFQLWQQGFPALKRVVIGSWRLPLVIHNVRIFTFAEVAFADFLILASLFLLTLFAQGVELRATRKARRLNNWLEDQVYQLSKASIAWALGPGQEQKPRWAIDVQEAMNALTGVMGQVELAVGHSVDNFDATIRGQEKVVSQFRGETALVTQTVSELTSFYQRVKEIYEKLSETIPVIVSEVTRLADTMEYGQDGNPERLDAMVDELSRLTQAMQTIAWAQRRPFRGGSGSPGYQHYQQEAEYTPPNSGRGLFAGIRAHMGGRIRR